MSTRYSTAAALWAAIQAPPSAAWTCGAACGAACGQVVAAATSVVGDAVDAGGAAGDRACWPDQPGSRGGLADGAAADGHDGDFDQVGRGGAVALDVNDEEQ